ncbi:MAG: acyl-ACP--UDP-N-acetylglucosamine O-acyltransferase [Gemmataceae bacterium]
MTIHPTAIVDPRAEIAEDVEIGAYVIIEGPVRIGRGCIIRPRAHLIGPLTLGEGNQVFSNAVLGERPQHVKYRDEPTGVEIGQRNVFRENVTVHRGTAASFTTRIGDDNYFMVGSHVAHDCVVGNRCIFANGAALAGHCHVGDGVFLSGNAVVHQFCRLGRLSMLSGTSATSKDVPPFIIQQDINQVVGINVVGMRRAGLSAEQIHAIRQVFHIVYLQGLSLPNALAQVEKELGHVDVVREFVEFVRASQRGINSTRVKREAA